MSGTGAGDRLNIFEVSTHSEDSRISLPAIRGANGLCKRPAIQMKEPKGPTLPLLSIHALLLSLHILGPLDRR